MLLVGAGFAHMAIPERLATSKGREVRTAVIGDGRAAVEFLAGEAPLPQPRPALVLMDLESAGAELSVLRQLKEDPELGCLPLAVFAPSGVDAAVVFDVYGAHANCCVREGETGLQSPTDRLRRLQRILDFWFDVVTLPATGCKEV